MVWAFINIKWKFSEISISFIIMMSKVSWPKFSLIKLIVLFVLRSKINMYSNCIKIFCMISLSNYIFNDMLKDPRMKFVLKLLKVYISFICRKMMWSNCIIVSLVPRGLCIWSKISSYLVSSNIFIDVIFHHVKET